MRIGILTFHRAHNYGAVLQAFALQEFLTRQGHEVEIIDYRQPFIEQVYKPFRLKRIKSKNPVTVIKKLKNEMAGVHKKNEIGEYYKSFLEEFLNVSDSVCTKASDIPNDYDLYIHGSDQIWNPKLLGGIYDPIYFGNYSVKHGKRISYAASFSNEPLKEFAKKEFTTQLKCLDAISVREKDLSNLIQECTDKPITDVLDPTLLAGSQIWDGLIVEPDYQNYLLIYQVGDHDITYELAKRVARERNLQIVDINKSEKYKTIGEYVGLFSKASFVVTTSFHGTAFSLIFKRPFYSIASGTGRDVRLKSLFNNLEIEDRLLVKQPAEIKDIDYVKVYEKLKIERDKSLNFILQF